jgi:hypothetical protein
MKSDLFEAALLKTQKTWKTYVKALCGLTLGFLIDWLGGLSFFKGRAEINLAGFKVVREALSLTYGLLFAAFIATAFYESRLLKTLSETAVRLPESTELELWYLSPFCNSRWRRFGWSYFFFVGYFLLAVFSFIHLSACIPPTIMKMRWYFLIGVVDGVILLACLWPGWRIYRNLRSVRHRLEMIDLRSIRSGHQTWWQ